MEGKIQVNSGDVSIIAVKVNNVDQTTIPGKDEGYSFQKAECTNGAIGNWNNANWEFRIQKLTQTKTKCTLYFVTGSVTGEQSGESKMDDLLDQNKEQTKPTLVSDDNNIRYIGKSPNNWVTFNGEKWRIIGLMDGIKTKDHGTQRLLKIIRNDSLGEYSWDSSAANVNSGNGVNEWSQADIQVVLNENYLKKTSGGTCYGGSKESPKACPDWTTVGLDTTARNMIEEVTWNTGTANTTDWYGRNFPAQQYKWERSANHGKQCSGDENSCNDSVNRTTEWTGKVGLIYPSDYGYATDGGGDLMKRGQCLYTPLSDWDQYYYCYQSDWLFLNEWTMTPAASRNAEACGVLGVNITGTSYNHNASLARAVRPVVYLKSSVKITGGTGEESSPYQLKLG